MEPFYEDSKDRVVKVGPGQEQRVAIAHLFKFSFRPS